MDHKKRLSVVALVLMTFGLVALLITYISQGWTTLGIVGCAGFAVAILASVLTLRSPGTTR